jgi:hypothetical protein
MIYALIVVTAMGATEAYQFSKLDDCNKASAKIAQSFCVEKKPVDVNVEIDKMFDIMKRMKEKMELL